MREDTDMYQSALDSHAADDLLSKLEVVCELGCTGGIVVSGGGDAGVVFLDHGQVVDAIVSDGPHVYEGIDAVAYLARRGPLEAEYVPSADFGKRTITATFPSIVTEVRRRLEGECPTRASAERQEGPGPVDIDMLELIELSGGKPPKKIETDHQTGRRRQRSTEPSPDDSKQAITEEMTMALDTILDDLKGVNGYLAAGVMNFTGEMLVSDSTSKSIDLALVGATFNDIFRSAHEASKKIGLEACRETVISTPNGVVIMHCTGADKDPHIHLVAVMKADGNKALMEMQLQKLSKKVVEELS